MHAPLLLELRVRIDMAAQILILILGLTQMEVGQRDKAQMLALAHGAILALIETVV